jgi:hypothetical protein
VGKFSEGARLQGRFVVSGGWVLQKIKDESKKIKLNP